MEKAMILQSDILDIVFHDRNKAYGAYELRKTYNKRLVAAILAMSAFAFLIVLFTGYATNQKHEHVLYVTDEINLSPVTPAKEVQTVKPLPPIEKIKAEPVKLAITKFVTPKVANDKLVTEVIKEQNELSNVRIGLENQEGLITNAVAPPVYIKGEGGAKFEAIAASVTNKKVEEEIFPVVQVQASYDGDWENFLKRNLNADLPVENGAPAGTYKVTVSFVVAKNGKISNVKALNNPGFGAAEEAVRVIKNSGNWNPGIQNNIQVNSYKKQTIVFVVE